MTMFYINKSSSKTAPTGEAETQGRSVALVAESGSDMSKLSVEEIADLMVLSTKFQEIENLRKQKEIDAKTANYQGLAQEIATLGVAVFLNSREVEKWNKKVKSSVNNRGWWISHDRAAVDESGGLYVMEKRNLSWWNWYFTPLGIWVGIMAMAVTQLNLDAMTAVMATYVSFAVGAFVVMEIGAKWRLAAFDYSRDDDRLRGWLEETKRVGLHEVSEARRAVHGSSKKENSSAGSTSGARKTA